MQAKVDAERRFVMADGDAQVEGAPVTKDRIEDCRKSAGFWVRELPKYADRQQSWADFWALAAGILAAATSVAIFPVITDDSPDWHKWVVAGSAFLAAIFALFPRVLNYAEMAGSARTLASRYGGIVGELIDLAAADPIPQASAKAILDEFEVIKNEKDGLRGLPDRDRIELKRLEQRRIVAAEEVKTAEAERAAAEARKAANTAKASAGGP
jgi:hypothetical protein